MVYFHPFSTGLLGLRTGPRNSIKYDLTKRSNDKNKYARQESYMMMKTDSFSDQKDLFERAFDSADYSNNLLKTLV